MTDDIHDSFVSLQQQVGAIQASLTAYAEHVETLIAASEATSYTRELSALRANGQWRTPQQEERFQELTQRHRERLHGGKPWSYMMDTPEGAVDTRSVLVKVLSDHEGEPLRQQGELRGGGKWVCNCTWEGESHAEHVADMYEAELSQQQKGK